MASTLTFKLVTVDGAPADPPPLTTVAPKWEPGDTIPLGRRTLRVIGVRNIDTGQAPMVSGENVRLCPQRSVPFGSSVSIRAGHQRIETGVPSGISRARRSMAALRRRMQPCETRPGRSWGASVP